MNLFRRTLLKTVLVASLLMPLTGVVASEKPELPLKIGFVYVSPIGDAGWTYQHDLGRRAVETAFGDRVRTKYVESVAEGADAERVIRDFAASGHQLVFTTSFGFMNPTLKVAKQFPKTLFEHATGYKQAPNVGIYAARYYEARYLAGIVAAKMSKTGIAGYVAAFPIPEVIMGINAFTQGMRSVNPAAQVKVIWVNAWFDPGKEREAALTLASQGADILTHHTDSTAVVQTAEEKGVWSMGYHSDMSKYGPKTQLTAAIHHWEDFYRKTVQQALEGQWASGNVWGGLKEGMVGLAPFNPAVPPEVAALVEERKQAIIAGQLHPFQGPLAAQGGGQVVGPGAVLDDTALLKMNYYVEGVVGQLPK
ncbi:MAG TPA: BMP family ABC transporter substrate-binding protein [Gammaproteobacteria bacterium]|nr:BMP family ABC transporter substrate-binding protein [Gammaproteobacteria bacterium]